MSNEVRYSRGCLGAAAGIVIAALLLLATVLVADAQRMPVIEHYRDSANTTQFKVTVPRDYMVHGPWLTVGTHSYQDWVQSMWNVSDSAYMTYITFIYMVDSTLLPRQKIQAEHFDEWHGLRYSAASVLAPPDSGIGGTKEGAWLRYKLNITAYDTIVFRQSSIWQGRKMEVRYNAVDGPLILTYESKNTGAWDNFQEFPVPLPPGLVGEYLIFFVFKEPALDLDWFELR